MKNFGEAGIFYRHDRGGEGGVENPEVAMDKIRKEAYSIWEEQSARLEDEKNKTFGNDRSFIEKLEVVCADLVELWSDINRFRHSRQKPNKEDIERWQDMFGNINKQLGRNRRS